jgi:5'-phosphate synthase pdxT subunit
MPTRPPARVPGQGLVVDRGPHPRPDAGPRSRPVAAAPTVGVLALQGDVLEHLRMLEAVGARPTPVKTPAELDAVDALLLPGGESTTIGRLLGLFELVEPLRERLAAGMPAFGTCAGAILLSRAATLHDGTPSKQPLIAALDVTARRNAFGRQIASFEAALDVADPHATAHPRARLDGGPLHAVFIRAPWFEEPGRGVTTLATVATGAGDRIVVVREGHILASAFHPELTGDRRLHAAFVELVRRS